MMENFIKLNNVRTKLRLFSLCNIISAFDRLKNKGLLISPLLIIVSLHNNILSPYTLVIYKNIRPSDQLLRN
jgi:hypothetical protein